jgi:opacity protein-like surface antigen
MVRAHTVAALALAACLSTLNASAQDSSAPTVTLAPTSPSRWDAAAHVAWLGERLNQPGDWDRWYGVASGGADVGYYWTSLLKVELDVATSTTGESYSYEQIPLPGSPVPSFVQREHEFRVTTASAGLNAQFFENAWFHPFIGAGMELRREREHVETTAPLVFTRDGRPVNLAVQEETRVRYTGRPFVGTGFKGYVSERVFIRADVRTSWSSDGVTAVAWRTGVGVDF